MNRRGFQVAISTMVVILLGIVLLSGGIYLLRLVTEETIGLNTQLTGTYREQLKGMLTAGQLVAVYPSQAVVGVGETGLFGLGIDNRLGRNETFSLSVTVLDEAGGSVPAEVVARLFTEAVRLEQNERQELPIVLAPRGGAAGVYTVIVTVTDSSGGVYDSPEFFTLTVR